MRKLLFILLFVQLYFINVFAQNNSKYFQHLSIENGLSSNFINCILQDDQGFIWIGTNDGLNKFNGYATKNFHPHDADSFSMFSNSISCGFKDNKNRLWFGGDCLMMCNPTEEKFINFKHENNNPNTIHSNDITVITQDENGIIWVGTREGLCMYNEYSKTFTTFLHDTNDEQITFYEKNRIIDLAPDMHGNLWMGTINGLYKFSLSTHTFSAFYHDKENENSMPYNKVIALTFDKKGKLWMVFPESELRVFDSAKKQFSKTNYPFNAKKTIANNIDGIWTDRTGKIWVTTFSNGVGFFNPVTNEWKQYLHDNFDPQSLADNITQTVFEDNSGIIWIGTERRGVDRISPDADKFTSYIQQPGKPNSLCENDITYGLEDKVRNLWIGSKNGLIYMNRKNDLFTCFKNDYSNQHSLSQNIITSIALDFQNNLWIATLKGLNFFNPKTKRWKAYYHHIADANSLPSDDIYDVVVKSNGKIWVGTSRGICCFNPFNHTFDHSFNNKNISKLKNGYYLTVFEDSEHNMWLSTSRSGILHVNDAYQILHSYQQSNGFNAKAVHQFAEDVDGNIWMAATNGLYRWNKRTATFSVFNSSVFSLNGDVKSIVIENGKIVWVGTPKGLIQIIFKNENEIAFVKKFDASDGLQSNAFNNCAGLKLKSGELFFGGLNGFNLFKPSLITYNNYIPPIQITSFKVFDKEINLKHTHDSIEEINLQYNQNFFSFEMVAMSFNHPEKNQFAYQLEGFDNEIIYCGTRQEASYTNVPPGKYVLHIMSSNNDGVWNKNGLRVKININPLIWQTIWFKILAIIFVLLITWIIIFYRIRKMKIIEQEKSTISKQIAEAKLSALRAQMNPHFIFNSINSIQQFITTNDKQEALTYLSKFAKLIRIILQNANRNTNTLEDELNVLQYYLDLERLRFANKFSYHFSIDESINIDSIEIPAMLLQPFVENAVIHGLLNKEGNGHLEIIITKNNHYLICTIQDDGIGREASMKISKKKMLKHESLSIKVNEERLNILEQITNKKATIVIEDLKDELGIAKGTKVKIEISIEEQT